MSLSIEGCERSANSVTIASRQPRGGDVAADRGRVDPGQGGALPDRIAARVLVADRGREAASAPVAHHRRLQVPQRIGRQQRAERFPVTGVDRVDVGRVGILGRRSRPLLLGLAGSRVAGRRLAPAGPGRAVGVRGRLRIGALGIGRLRRGCCHGPSRRDRRRATASEHQQRRCRCQAPHDAPRSLHALNSLAGNVLLRHHADLLRQRGAAPRPCLHDDRCRHPRPPHAPARRGRVLSDRHRRSRGAGGPGRRAARRHPARARRQELPAVPRPDAEDRCIQRLLHPHQRSGARGQGPGGDAAGPRQRPRLRGHLRGLLLSALRRLQDADRARTGQHLSDPRDRARAGEGAELVLPALHLPGGSRAAVRGASRRSSPPTSGPTRRSRSSGAVCRTSLFRDGS